MNPGWNSLLELDIGFDISMNRIANFALSCSEYLVTHQCAVFEIDMQESTLDCAVNHT